MLFSLTETVAAVAEVGKEVTPEQERERRRLDRDIDRMQEEERTDHEAAMQAMGRQQYLWGNETLRKTTLAPGQMVGGRVRFQVRGDSMPWDLVLPVGADTLRATFQVEKHQP